MKADDFERKLKAAIKEITTSENLKLIGQEMAERIKKRTRLGYGVPRVGADRERLIPLSEKYKELRSKSKLSGATSQGKSNLTRTGQMLDSMQVKEIVSGKSVSVGPKGDRQGEDITNEKLAEYVSEQGRPFNTLSKPEIKGLVNFINDLLKRILKL